MAAVREDVESEFLLALNACLESLVHKTLKVEQKESIRQIVCQKEDVLAVLLTGFGKKCNIIKQLILNVLTNMQGSTDSSTLIAPVRKPP